MKQHTHIIQITAIVWLYVHTSEFNEFLGKLTTWQAQIQR